MELKKISHDAIPRALEKAERYRLLNEPHEAESICRDILAIEPNHEGASIALLLSLTDQFTKDRANRMNEARTLSEGLPSELERAYYLGIVCERWAKVQLREGAPGHVVYSWVRDAMGHYERAETLEPAGNDDAVLRWNACVRLIEEHQEIRPRADAAENAAIEGGDEGAR